MIGAFLSVAQKADEAKRVVGLLGGLGDGDWHTGLYGREFVEADDLQRRLLFLQIDRKRVPGDADVRGADVGDAVADFVDVTEVGWVLCLQGGPKIGAFKLLLDEFADRGYLRA